MARATGGRERKSQAKTSRTSRGGAARSTASSKRTQRSTAQTTTDHDEIQRWAEERGGQPACVKGTGNRGDIGMIRIDFPGYSGERSLQPISWDEWFEKFDESNLALLYQETTARGQKSNFNKLIGRETAEARQRGETKASRYDKKTSGRVSARSGQKIGPQKAETAARRSGTSRKARSGQAEGARTTRRKAA